MCSIILQLGYEPIAPRPGRTIFGKPALILPNILQYGKSALSCFWATVIVFLFMVLLVNYIRKVDGLVGCYRGLAPKIFGNILGSLGSERVAAKLGFGQAHVDPTQSQLIIPDDV